MENINQGAEATDPVSFAMKFLPNEVFNAISWDALKPAYSKDKLIGWYTYTNIQNQNSLLVISYDNGVPSRVQINKFEYGKQTNGLLELKGMHTQNFITGATKRYNFQSTRAEGSNGLRNARMLSLVSPGTLPNVTIYGKYKGPGSVKANPFGSTTYVFNGLLGFASTSSSTGGSNYSETYGMGTNPLDPNLYFAALEPAGSMEGGSDALEWPEVIDFSENRVVKGIWYSRLAYPGIQLGFPWIWWENYDKESFGSWLDQETFQDNFLTACKHFELDFNTNTLSQNLYNHELDDWQPYLANYASGAAPPIPLIPILMNLVRKAGINAGADIFMQLFINYLIEENYDIWDAWEMLDLWQAARSGVEGLISTKSTSLRITRAAGTGAADVMQKWYRDWYQKGKGDDYSFDDLIKDFSIGFTGDLGGGYLGDMASKYPVDRVAKGLVKKLGMPYGKVCNWMGKGLKEIAETINSVTSLRRMEGWAPGKVAIIGRQMEVRVKKFAEGLPGSVVFDETNPIAAKYFTADVKDDWNQLVIQYGGNVPYSAASQSKLFKANQQFIEDLKAEGYTFIDCGPGTASGNSAFYDMELNQIFN